MSHHYADIKNIYCLKEVLTQEALETVVHAFVASRINYCNSLLYGISVFNINCLQRIQNSADALLNIHYYYYYYYYYYYITVKNCPVVEASDNNKRAIVSVDGHRKI